MKITIDENGNVEPAGSAELLSKVGQTQTLRDGVDISNDVSARIFQCSYCEKVIEAPAGQVTTHECDEPKKQRRRGQVV